MDGDERIEIELDEFDDDHSHAVRDDVDDELAADQRRTLIATIVGVGVIALALGWIIGSSAGSSPNDASATATTTTNPAVTATTVNAADTIPAPRPTTIPLPPRPTTTTIPSGQPFPLDINPSILGFPYEIALSSTPGRVITIDLQTGQARDFDIDVDSGQPMFVHYSADGRLLAVPTYELTSVAVIDTTADSTGPLVVGTELPDDVDSIAFDGARRPFLLGRGPLRSTTIRPLNDPTAAPAIVYGYVAVRDPAGGFVISADAGLFQWTDTAPAELITSGRIIALGVDRALVVDCIGIESCDYVVIDRATGSRTVVQLDLSAYGTDPPTEISFWTDYSSTTQAPTIIGDVAYLTLTWSSEFEYRTQGAKFHLDTGVVEPFGVEASNFVSIPTDDWNWVFTVDEQLNLLATDMATGLTTSVLGDDSLIRDYDGQVSMDVRRLPEP